MCALYAHELAEERHEGRIFGRIEAKRFHEVFALQGVVTGIVKIAKTLLLYIELVQHDGCLRMLLTVISSSSIGQPERVSLGAHELPSAQLLLGVFEKWLPNRQFLYVDAVELIEIIMRGF